MLNLIPLHYRCTTHKCTIHVVHNTCTYTMYDRYVCIKYYYYYYYTVYIIKYMCILYLQCTYVLQHSVHTYTKSLDNTRLQNGPVCDTANTCSTQCHEVKYMTGNTLTSGLLKVFGSWYSNLLGKGFLPFFGWLSLFLTCKIPVAAPFVEDLPNTILSHSFNHDKSVLLVPY